MRIRRPLETNREENKKKQTMCRYAVLFFYCNGTLRASKQDDLSVKLGFVYMNICEFLQQFRLQAHPLCYKPSVDHVLIVRRYFKISVEGKFFFSQTVCPRKKNQLNTEMLPDATYIHNLT